MFVYNSNAFRQIRIPTSTYMGLCNSPDIFQERMYKIFSDLEYVRVCIDNLLVTSCSTFEEHLQRLELVFSRLSETRLKVNANKSHFAVSEIEYLGYWITRNGIQPVPKKVEAIQCIAPPTTRKQVQSFIGLINYYRDMWPRSKIRNSSSTNTSYI
jgi:putative transposase